METSSESVAPGKMVKSAELPHATSEEVMVNGNLEDQMGHSPAAAGGGGEEDVSVKATMEVDVIAAAAAAEAEHLALQPTVDLVKARVQEDTPNNSEENIVTTKPKPKKAAPKKPKPAAEPAENNDKDNATKSNPAISVTETKQKRQRKRKSDPDFIEDPRLGKTMNGEVSVAEKKAAKVETAVPPKPKKKKVAAKKETAEKPKETPKKPKKAPAKAVVSKAKQKGGKKKEAKKETAEEKAAEKTVEKTVEKQKEEEDRPESAGSTKTGCTAEENSCSDNATDKQNITTDGNKDSDEMDVTESSAPEKKVVKSKGGAKNKAAPKSKAKTVKAVKTVKTVKEKEKSDVKVAEKKEKPKKKSPKKKKTESKEEDSKPEDESIADNNTEAVEKETKVASKDESSEAAPSTNNNTQEKPKRKAAKKKKKEEPDPAVADPENTDTADKSKKDSPAPKPAPAKKSAAKKKAAKAASAETNIASPKGGETKASNLENTATVPNDNEDKSSSKSEEATESEDHPQEPPVEKSTTTSTATAKKEKKKKSAKEATECKPESASKENKDQQSSDIITDNAKEGVPAPETVSLTSSKKKATTTTTEEKVTAVKSSAESKDKMNHTEEEGEQKEEAGEETDKFSCSQCDYRGKNKASLLKHLKNHHGIFQCSHCEFTSTTKENMDEHMKSHPSSKWGKRKCPKCIRFIDPADFEDHEKLCTGKPEPIVCPECQKEFRFKAMFESHMKSHQAPKQPKPPKAPSTGSTGAKKCHKCGRRYSREDLETHSRGCDGTPVPFVCPECKKEFRFMAKLRNHMKIHLKHEDMEFQCDICDYKTPFFGYLEKHMGAMHDKTREKTVACPDCQKLFYTNSNMQNHVKYSCITRDPHSCDVCGKTVKSLDALRRHKVSHEDDKNVVCDADNCSMAFKTKRHLTYHKKNVHGEGIKKFKCPQEDCDEAFLKKSQMTRHLSVHTGDRKYVCQYDGCSKAFRHPDNLKVHTLQHTNEKPIKCELCEYACRQRSSIQHHMRTKHPTHPYKMKKLSNKGSESDRGTSLRDSDTGGSQSDASASSSGKDIYDFNDEDEKSSLPPLAKSASKSPRPKLLMDYSLPIETEHKPAGNKKKKAQSSGQDTDNDRPPQKKKKKTTASKESKAESTAKRKTKKQLLLEKQKEEEEAMMQTTEEENDSMEETAPQHSLESNMDYSGSTSGDLVPDTYSPGNEHLETSDHTVQDGDDELPADFDPEKHMAEAFGPEAAYDIANMSHEEDPEHELNHADLSGQSGHPDTGAYPETSSAPGFVPPLHAITEPVTGEALVEKMKEDFSEEQLEQLAKETQEELNAVMSAGHISHTVERLNSIGSHGDDSYPSGVEVPVITSHHQGAPHSVEYSAPSSNLPPPSHEAPSSIPPPSNEPVPSQEPPGYPMSHDSQRNYAYSSTGEPTNQAGDVAATVNNGHPPSTDVAVSQSSLPPYSSAVPYPAPYPPVSPTSSVGAISAHDTAPSSSYSAPLSSPYLSPTYTMPLTSSLPTYDSTTYNQTATSRSQETLPNTESQGATQPSRTPESLYASSSRGATSTSTFPTDSFSRELFGQYFQDPSSMPLTHPPMSQDPQRPSYLPQQQPGFPSMLSRTSTDLLRRPPMMPASGYGTMADSLVGMNPAALSQQHGQQTWMGHDERSRTWSQASPIIMGATHELGTNSPLAAATRNPYSDRPEYSFDPNASSQLGRRPGETGFPVPQTLANPTQHYDMASAYMTARSLNPSTQDTTYTRAVGSAATNSQNRLEDAYRHMTDYRALPQPPSMADMYGRMGMNPALGLDKYYYPARDAMYRSQHITSTGNPFLPPTSTAQMGYTDREYSRNAMYTQHSAYGFMGDKQFLPSSKITPGVPSPADYFQPRPGATDPHIQDPYRRIYNMMRYY